MADCGKIAIFAPTDPLRSTKLIRNFQNKKRLAANNGILTKFMAGRLSRLERLEALLDPDNGAAELLVAVDPGDYSASGIARAVEDCDSQLLALSVTPMRDALGRLVVMVRVDSAAGPAVSRSLERYGYETIHTRFPGDDAARLRAMDRANELLRYLTV